MDVVWDIIFLSIDLKNQNDCNAKMKERIKKIIKKIKIFKKKSLTIQANKRSEFLRTKHLTKEQKQACYKTGEPK